MAPTKNDMPKFLKIGIAFYMKIKLYFNVSLYILLFFLFIKKNRFSEINSVPKNHTALIPNKDIVYITESFTELLGNFPIMP